MRKAAFILAVATVALGAGIGSTPARAECVVAAPGFDGYAPAYYGYRRSNPYSWYTGNYSNWTPADCAYYDRRFFGAYVIHSRVRYIHRYYR